MKLLKFAVVALLLLAAPAFAQEKKPLTVEEVLGATTALRALKTYTALDKAGTAVQLPYKFPSTVAFDMAMNIAKGDQVGKAYQDVVNGLVSQLSDGGTQVPPAKMLDFQAQNRKVLDAPAKIEMTRFKRSDLNVDGQPIAPETLMLLLPILD